MKVPAVCPRCSSWIPSNDNPGAYPGAISRTDDRTEICSDCGTMEAMEQYQTGHPMPQEAWDVVPPARR